MTHVVLDTNVLMMPIEVGVRTFEELDRLVGDYEAIVPRAVLAELEEFAGAHGTEATAASVGEDLARRHCEIRDHEASFADDAVIELARDADCAATNDGPLKRRLLEADVPVISLRGRTKLEITRP